MEIAELFKLAAQAGGPTTVACLAMWIIHKRDQQTLEIMKQQREMAKSILECQVANTEALTRLTVTIGSQGEVNKQLRDLLIKINGR